MNTTDMSTTNMNAATSRLERDCTSTLGIPVDNLSLVQAVDQIVAMARTCDGRARLVSTVNVDFLVNALGYAGSQPRHPELLSVLRNSDMVTADGFPIVWLSKILGKPLKARVTGADMVPAIAARAAEENLSLYLLGGGQNSAAAAAEKLQADNPGLRIAGINAPFIHTSGPQLTGFVSEDQKILDEINASGADILLVGLGNPKQELWFNRNRDKLKVPVSIGVGGTFEFINGAVKRAPKLLQRLNLEWIFRMTQDPSRLWRRYVTGIFKLGIISAPLFYYRLKELLLYRQKGPVSVDSIRWQSVWSSREQSLALLRLPQVLTEEYLKNLLLALEAQGDSTALRVLDFSEVKHIEAAGHHELFRLAEVRRTSKTDISVLGMSATVKRHLSACRIMDVLGEGHSGNALTVMTNDTDQTRGAETGCRSFILRETTLIFLSGCVNADSFAQLGLQECLEHTARDRVSILDFSGVTLLESSGVAALLPVFASMHERKSGAVLISGAGVDVKQMFRMTDVGDSVIFIDDKTLLSCIAAEDIDLE